MMRHVVYILLRFLRGKITHASAVLVRSRGGQAGLQSAEDVKGLNVVTEVDMTGKSDFAPGPDPSTYAYSRMTAQRNLFRIRLK